MAQVLCHIPKNVDPNLIVGIDTSDDGAVYKINDDTAIIQTVDFFTPVVDDPYVFGQIAAANSMSDIYAMGSDPKLAMNIIAFPNCLSADVMTEILKGGNDKVLEAGALIVGGHTIEDDEPKYGLSVTGFINPKDVVRNSSAKEGDYLILTKPLGIGILNTAIKADMASENGYKEAIKTMTTLNKKAKDSMMEVGVNSATDVTGFGFLGHGLEMAKGSNKTFVFYSDKVHFIEEAYELANMGIIPEGAYNNKTFIGDNVKISEDVSEPLRDILFDPQTSGGLLISVSKEKKDGLMEKLKDLDTEYRLVGRVLAKQDHYIVVE